MKLHGRRDITWSGNTGTIFIPDDGRFPGNSRVPVVHYRAAVPRARAGDPAAFEQLFSQNGWEPMWRNGIFSYHHYHSTAHEVLGVYHGRAVVQFGGPDGLTVEIEVTDAVLIPAGVAHKLLSSSGLAVVGAYPPGPPFDLLRGRPGERPKADENIGRLPPPPTDPVYGSDGPLRSLPSGQ